MDARETIGGYRILNKIGSSYYGEVYRARDPQNDRDVALKILTESSDLERAGGEAQLAHETGHPNIIRILGHDRGSWACFIVMEMMPTSLREILGNGRLSLSRSVDICRQVALGLRAAHARGVIHRDVKPNNILIDSNGTVKVSDFGIAHPDHLPSLMPNEVWIGGAGRYMSPEQWKGGGADARSDIYSLGVVLHEMLTGETPFIIAGETRSVKKWIRPSVPTGLERIFEKCTELDPKRRYQTMDELIESISLDLVNRCALMDFYEGARGIVGERGWRTDEPLSDWDGVTANLDGVVSEIRIRFRSAYGRHGEIPSEIAYLSELESLDLGLSGFSGSIPPELANLAKLKKLILGRNGFSGSIPPELGNLTELEHLTLGSTRLSGSIPPELGNLTELEHLNLRDSHLTGSIPPELGGLTKLKVLGLSGNGLTGSIPPELGSLTKLEILDLDNNGLTGSIPPELGKLTRLKILHISGNKWTGCIPKSLFDIPDNDLRKIKLPVCDG